MLIDRPGWLKKRLIVNGRAADTERIISEERLNTVCSSSLCPNKNECFSSSQATFLILGDICTRKCAFCSAKKGMPASPEYDEPLRIAAAIGKLNLRYVVLTSVTRDDIADGGATQFAETIARVKRNSHSIRTEVLTPDFAGNVRSVHTVIDARPDVFGHNIETVERLYSTVRMGADYRRSLDILKSAKEAGENILTKSSIMLGLGEREPEVLSTMRDLSAVGCDILTIGQYLRPRQDNVPVQKYAKPEEFENYRVEALRIGFKSVASGPFVRSSYMAEEAYGEAKTWEMSYDRS